MRKQLPYLVILALIPTCALAQVYYYGPSNRSAPPMGYGGMMPQRWPSGLPNIDVGRNNFQVRVPWSDGSYQNFRFDPGHFNYQRQFPGGSQEYNYHVPLQPSLGWSYIPIAPTNFPYPSMPNYGGYSFPNPSPGYQTGEFRSYRAPRTYYYRY